MVRSMGAEAGEAHAIRGGAGMVGPDGSCWVLVQDDPERGVGMTLAWSVRHGSPRPACIVDVDPQGRPQSAAAGVAARKGAALRSPVSVRWVEGSRVHEAVAAPAPAGGPFAPSAAAAVWLDGAAAAGLDVSVLGDGSVSFEVLGLEVGRATAEGVLEVGSGRHDRDATDEVWAGAPGQEALVRAAESVRIERRRDRIPTLASTLQRERWLRRALVADPSPLGLAALESLPEAAPAADLRRPRPAGAVTADRSTLVVCSTGADLDLIPTAADLWATHAPGAERIMLVVPPGDDHPVTRELATLLPVAAEVLVVDPPWA